MGNSRISNYFELFSLWWTAILFGYFSAWTDQRVAELLWIVCNDNKLLLNSYATCLLLWNKLELLRTSLLALNEAMHFWTIGVFGHEAPWMMLQNILQPLYARLWLCTVQTAPNAWAQSLNSFHQWLEQRHTSLDIVSCPPVYRGAQLGHLRVTTAAPRGMWTATRGRYQYWWGASWCKHWGDLHIADTLTMVPELH